MSIKHRKGRQIDAFDWIVGDGLILAHCREIPAYFNGENFIRRAARKNLSKKMFTGEEFRILSFDFFFRISFLRLYKCGHDLHRE